MVARYALAAKLNNSKPVVKENFIQDACRGKSVLDLGCIRHSANFAINDPNWLHKIIKFVAKKVIGVDYLPDEIKKLNALGYDIIWGDVTKPLAIHETFDVIVAGDLIEHLANFEGFFENCSRLLKADGVIIITTPNPFYAGEFHFTAFKKRFLINPEHTCWIDPQALSQLSNRFSYEINEIYFIKNSWSLKNLICETEQHPYDILQGVWQGDSLRLQLMRRIMGAIFNLFYVPYTMFTGSRSRLVRHSDYLAVLARRADASSIDSITRIKS
ncbi:MAG TPA: class I SAM-dependent methyltransferase [Nitrospirota bacterium]|nr:class I SAM-dependent methyltransferase [Nitrospirota bacterium]